MSLIYLAYRNIVSKPLNLLLSLLLLILSVSLVTFVLQLNTQLGNQLNKNIAPFDMVVGAKGSPLQLILSSVLHIDNPTGNISLKECESIRKHPFVKTAIPVSYGDNYKGYRILGTTKSYLDQYNVGLDMGNPNQHDFEAVLGYEVANKLGLEVGDQFSSSHGLASSALESHEENPFTITGILKPSGTVVDKLIITNLESIWLAHDHTEIPLRNHKVKKHPQHEPGHEHGHEHEHEHEQGKEEKPAESSNLASVSEEDQEITSLLVKFKNPIGMVQMPRFINEKTSMQAALPGFEIQRLIGLLGSGTKTINGIALAILLISGLSIFISLLKTLRERKQELALLRVYGFGTARLIGLVLIEAILLAFLGFVIGWGFGRLALLVASNYSEGTFGYGLELTAPNRIELGLLLLTLLIAALAAILASRPIFNLNIAKTLTNA